MQIRRATAADAETVGQFAFELFVELAAPATPGYDMQKVIRTARQFLERGNSVWAFLAEEVDSPVALITLNECASIYSGGHFGEICELYVRPPFRGGSVGTQLIDSAVDLARERGWLRLEVGAPAVPQWQRTVAFYERYGFTTIGPRLKFELLSGT